ncbi:MAG: EAL domain-containing protein [Pseudomonadota bacterium]|nr:EAL domain-containing protein [Pseudomonadota bacterium]
MRRTRFAGAVDAQSGRLERVTTIEALWFDVGGSDEAGQDSLASWRVASLEHSALLLAATHVLAAFAFLAYHWERALEWSTANPLIPLLLVLALDAIAAVALHLRGRFEIAPRTMIRLLCLYVGAVGVLWALVSYSTLQQPHSGHEAIPILAVATGVAMAAVVSVNSPPLALINLAVTVLATLLLTGSAATTVAMLVVLGTLAVYSVASARTVIAAGRKRLNLDAEARKALTFVDEFENSGRGWFWETNAQGTLSYVSLQLAEDFECEPRVLLGRQFNDLLSVDSGGDAPFEERTLGFHLSVRFPFSDVVVRAASDRDIHWSLSGNPIFDERGQFHGFRGIGTDLTEQRRSEQEITRLARFDSLTGLPNRPMMRQTLDEALRNADRRQRGCALFLIDLDRFKNVNDTLGHPVGDALLRLVAQRLTTVIGDHGKIGRLGGDEFMAVFPGTVDVGLLESLARTLIEQVSRIYLIEGHRVTIGASVGIAIGDPGRACADSLVRDSDLALYAAKAAGRGKHCFYEPSMHSEASDRQVLENDLRQALDRDELWVAFQPIVGAAGEEISGFEALIRWAHPSRGPVTPDKFIPLAEECGMIGRIGEWVLDKALAEAAYWPDHVRIAVNLSPIQFNDPSIVETVGGLLAKHSVRAERLELEITEGVFLAEGGATDDTFARLKDLGVRLALDDFGTGYSSLGYLKKAPFDKIKIDQSFVRGAASKASRNGAIIRAIVTLAESLDMDTCAEGVETHDELNLIRELGCSHIQGYIFGRPAEAETARALANAANVEADGFPFAREPRQRLMRRALTAIGGKTMEIRLRNISAMGALAECSQPVAPDTQLTIDIVGVGPVTGVVRWAQAGRFGVQFVETFDLALLAPKKIKQNKVTMLRPWYIDQQAAS